MVLNLNEFLSSAEYTCYFEERGKPNSYPSIKVNVDQQLFGYPRSSKYLILCSAHEKKKKYRFGTTCEWVNNDRKDIFGWTIFNDSRQHV